jgi:hypothetical protein
MKPVLKLVRAIRRKLREIRYYSAARPSTAWSRAADIALAVGLLAAFPVAWTTDRGLSKGSIAASISGKLFAHTDGSIWAATNSALSPQLVPAGATPHGAFDLAIRSERRGWPFPSSWSRAEPALSVELYVPRRTLENAELSLGSALRETIASAASEPEEEEALEMLRGTAGGSGAEALHLRGWVANTMVWALMLPLAAWAVVGLARLVWLPIETRRVESRLQRTKSGRCAACGYDLRGNPFGGHCPECGAML